jgi:UDP-2,3-diacylglucosamine hydrolase
MKSTGMEKSNDLHSGIAYFLSDAHLGRNLPYDGLREKYLCDFFLQIRDRATHLFIIGDLFDFWIEYDYAIRPDYFDTLWALKSLSHAGVELHYVAGNHDFALGPFLRDKISLRLHPDQFEIELQGRRLLLAHGDGLLNETSPYLILRGLLRNPVCQKLYKLLHPNMGVRLGTFFSRMSRRRGTQKDLAAKCAAYRKWALGKLATDVDMVLLGHTHAPEMVKTVEGAYCNVGNWMGEYTFAKLEDGTLTLNRFPRDTPNIKAGPAHPAT